MPGASAKTMREKSGGVVAIEWRSLVKALRADVRSTLPEARTGATVVVRTRSRREVDAGDGRSAHGRGAGGRSDRSEGEGKARVAEWRRGGANRVLGDTGRWGAVPKACACGWQSRGARC